MHDVEQDGVVAGVHLEEHGAIWYGWQPWDKNIELNAYWANNCVLTMSRQTVLLYEW